MALEAWVGCDAEVERSIVLPRQADPPRVKRQAIDAVLRAHGSVKTTVSPVRIAHNRVPDGAHMASDLVTSACEDPKMHQREAGLWSVRQYLHDTL